MSHRRAWVYGLGAALGFLGCTGAAEAALSLRFLVPGGPGAADLCSPGRHSLDLVFTETGPAENEGLFAYDIVVRLVGAGGGPAPAGVALAGGGEPPDNFVLDVPSGSQVRAVEDTPTGLFLAFFSNEDLADINTGDKAARINYFIDASAVGSTFRIELDSPNTVFGSGDPTRPTEISVEDTDGVTITACPEPGALALAAIAAPLALRRGRRTAGHSA